MAFPPRQVADGAGGPAGSNRPSPRLKASSSDPSCASGRGRAWQVTDVDAVSRPAVVEARSFATAGMAAAFLDPLLARAPFPIRAIAQGAPVDGGRECTAESEAECQTRAIRPFVLPPRSPKLNGGVERLNRTFRQACRGCFGGELELGTHQAARREAERVQNEARPHQALGYLTPAAHLAAPASPTRSGRPEREEASQSR